MDFGQRPKKSPKMSDSVIEANHNINYKFRISVKRKSRSRI